MDRELTNTAVLKLAVYLELFTVYLAVLTLGLLALPYLSTAVTAIASGAPLIVISRCELVVIEAH